MNKIVELKIESCYSCNENVGSLIINNPDGTWSVRLWARNLADEENVTGHYVTSDTSGMYTNYFLTEPKIVGASFKVNF